MNARNHEISNSDDVIDSRDVIARVAELESERADLESEAQDDTNVVRDEAIEALKQWDDENGGELKALQSLAEEAGGSADWTYGETLIRESYFKDYAQELAEDIGAIDAKATWPNTCIDWQQAARELKMDYTTVSYDGVDYLIRS